MLQPYEYLWPILSMPYNCNLWLYLKSHWLKMPTSILILNSLFMRLVSGGHLLSKGTLFTLMTLFWSCIVGYNLSHSGTHYLTTELFDNFVLTTVISPNWGWPQLDKSRLQQLCVMLEENQLVLTLFSRKSFTLFVSSPCT